MTTTYIFFYRAVKAQGIDRNTLPYTGWFQPYGAWFALVFEVVVVFCYGYASFLPWDISGFFSSYTMVGVAPVLYCFWKLLKRTKVVKPLEADLVWDRPVIDAYEDTFLSPPVGFWREMLQLFSFNLLGKVEGGNDRRVGSVS